MNIEINVDLVIGGAYALFHFTNDVHRRLKTSV
jgi:hypothetical protein